MDDYINAVQQQIAQNNAWSAEQAQKQMEFQERMSNTAHQREIADLKAAGLNPVLSARLGGASTPSGAMASVDNSGTSAFAQILTKVLDIQNENAKALQTMSGIASSSTGSAKKEAAKDKTSDFNGLLTLTGNGLSSDAKKLANNLYELGDEVADYFGLEEDSKVRKYLNGNWTLADTKEAVDSASKAVYNTAKKVSNSIGNAVAKITGKSLPSEHSKTSSSSVVKKGSSR